MANIGLGMAALGRPGYINLGHAEDLEGNYTIGAMRRRAFEVLDFAWESGVRYFDVARSYGRAEEFLGSWIRDRKISPNEIRVGSKWGYTYTAAWQVETPDGVEHEVKRHELKILKNQYGASFSQLGSHLQLYQIHSATLESGVLENTEVIEVLCQLRQAGLSIGLSVSGPNQSATIEKASKINFDGVRLFDSVQVTWNLLERSAGEALVKVADTGMQVIVKEALANGRLTSRNNDPNFAGSMERLKQVAKDLDTTVDALSIAVAMSQPWCKIVLSGAATVEHLQSNLAAGQLKLPSGIETELKDLIENPAEYWDKRSQLSWN